MVYGEDSFPWRYWKFFRKVGQHKINFLLSTTMSETLRKLKLEELNRISVEDFKSSDKHPIVVVLDNIRSMHNVGSVFRSGDAFRVAKIFLCGFTPQPPHREIRKTAIGATESVDWHYEREITVVLKQLKEEGYRIMAIEQTSTSIPLVEFDTQKDEKYAFIFGNEVDGVQKAALEYCEGAIEIRQFGTKHSLNISVAAGIVMHSVVQPLLAE